MSGLYFKDTEQLKQAQKDILWNQDTGSNELLTSSPVPAMNQKLKTTGKKIISAINEINDGVASVKTSTASSMALMQSAIGNVFNEQSEDYLKLKAMGNNVIDALENIKEEVSNVSVTSIDGGEF